MDLPSLHKLGLGPSPLEDLEARGSNTDGFGRYGPTEQDQKDRRSSIETLGLKLSPNSWIGVPAFLSKLPSGDRFMGTYYQNAPVEAGFTYWLNRNHLRGKGYYAVEVPPPSKAGYAVGIISPNSGYVDTYIRYLQALRARANVQGLRSIPVQFEIPTVTGDNQTYKEGVNVWINRMLREKQEAATSGVSNEQRFSFNNFYLFLKTEEQYHYLCLGRFKVLQKESENGVDSLLMRYNGPAQIQNNDGSVVTPTITSPLTPLDVSELDYGLQLLSTAAAQAAPPPPAAQQA